jgi:fumarate hydratase subunit beta
MKMSKNKVGIVKIWTPISNSEIKKLNVGDRVEIWGKIFCGRDTVLPKLASLSQKSELHSIRLNFEGSVIFHTAVSASGIGPTTSNKFEIETSIPELSRAGVKIHLGKGSLARKTTNLLKRYNAVFAITPPLTALFSDKVVSQKVVAFKEEGMEALYELEVEAIPAIIAIAHGVNIFTK